MRNHPFFPCGLGCLEQCFKDVVLANGEIGNVNVSVLELVWSGKNGAHDSPQRSDVYRIEFHSAIIIQCCSALFGVEPENIPFQSLRWLLVN